METTVSRVGTQPGLSVTNEEIVDQFAELVKIPQGAACGPAFVGAIGEEQSARDGNTYTPVAIYQMRNDLYPGSKSEANSFFRKWDALENMVKHIEQVTPDQMKALNIAKGLVIPGAQLFVDYKTGAFFTKGDGTPQDPVLNPRTDKYLAVGTKLVYRNTRIQWTENMAHTGLEIRQAAEEVDEDTKNALQLGEQNEQGTVVVTL